jgi:hypothetical protein
VLAVQNSVRFEQIGTATSSAAFFRSIGGSVGVAVFGTIYANQLAAALPRTMRAAGSAAAHFTPAQLKSFPPAVQATYLHAFSHALHIVFLGAVPFAAIGIVLALLLKEVPLRTTTGRSAGMDAAESMAMIEVAESVTPEETPAAAR